MHNRVRLSLESYFVIPFLVELPGLRYVDVNISMDPASKLYELY